MRRALVIAMLLLSCRPSPFELSGGGFGGSGDTGGTPERFVVATYNVHRFFDTVCDSGRCGVGDYEERPTLAEFEAKADAVATAVRRLSVDAICLEEVESQRALDALGERLPELPSLVMGETGAHGSIDVALLARDPVTLIRRHRSRPLSRPDGSATSFAREFLEVHLDVDGCPAIVFCAHFKSKADDDPGRRLAEAEAAAAIIAEEARRSPEALIVLGGDLNDTPGSPPLEALEASGALLRVAGDMAGSQATYSYNGQPLALDHLYVHLGSGGGYVGGSAAILRDGEGRGLGGSDHAALRALFQSCNTE